MGWSFKKWTGLDHLVWQRIVQRFELPMQGIFNSKNAAPVII
jgi:hypothetical protein